MRNLSPQKPLHEGEVAVSDKPTDADAVAAHERAAADVVARVAVLTVSDSRTLADDRSGDTIVSFLESSRHAVAAREIVHDDPVRVAAWLDRWLPSAEVDAVITTGGTGVSARDRTVRVVRERILTELPGFGETFRRLSFDEIGPPAMLSRAVAGVTGPPNPSALFALPGSENAVRLATETLILPILPHLLRELRKESLTRH